MDVTKLLSGSTTASLDLNALSEARGRRDRDLDPVIAAVSAARTADDPLAAIERSLRMLVPVFALAAQVELKEAGTPVATVGVGTSELLADVRLLEVAFGVTYPLEGRIDGIVTWFWDVDVDPATRTAARVLVNSLALQLEIRALEQALTRSQEQVSETALALIAERPVLVATGVVMATHGLSEQKAKNKLLALAADRGLRARELAAELLRPTRPSGGQHGDELGVRRRRDRP